MRTVAFMLVGIVAAACDRNSSDKAAQAAGTIASASTSAGGSASAAPASDGTDPKLPVLSPDDATFVDSRKGYGWSDRCFTEIKLGKWGWARAACDRGLALPEVDEKVRPLLLYNEGLISKQAGDSQAARNYFSQSLLARPPTDPGRPQVEKELLSVGGTVPSSPASVVEVFTGKALVEQMSFANVKPAYSDLNFATLYRADINNDGRMEFVLCERNSVGLHNDQLLGVYESAPSTGVMVGSQTPLPNERPFVEGNVFYFATPFLRADLEGVTMTFVEGKKRTRYLWKGGHIRLLDRG